jgi:hypothetical protein
VCSGGATATAYCQAYAFTEGQINTLFTNLVKAAIAGSKVYFSQASGTSALAPP